MAANNKSYNILRLCMLHVHGCVCVFSHHLRADYTKCGTLYSYVLLPQRVCGGREKLCNVAYS